MVLANGPVKHLEHMKGRVVATNAGGSAVDLAMRSMLRKVGLEQKRDYVMVEAPLPTMRAMLAEKKADLVPCGAILIRPGVAPYRQAAVLQPRCHGSDAAPVLVRAPVLHRQEPGRDGRFHGRHAADHLLVSRSGEPCRSRGDCSRLTKQPPERLGWVFTKQDYYHVPGMRPDLDALQRNVALIKELGLISADTDVKKHSDLTLLDDAAKRLK